MWVRYSRRWALIHSSLKILASGEQNAYAQTIEHFRKISTLVQFFLNDDPVFGLVIQLKVRNPVGDGVVIELFGTTRSVMDAVGGCEL